MNKVKVTLVDHTVLVKDAIANATRKCHDMKHSCSKSVQKAIENGHLSLLEHAYASFDIECSLAVLGQLTRHRHFSFTVKSSRAALFDSFVVPPSLKDSPYFTVVMHTLLHCYKNLIDTGTPKEDAAYILPKGTLTKLTMTGNIRAWFEYLPKRLCSRALPEHRKVAELIHEELKKVCPLIFDREFKKCNDGCKEDSCTFSKEQPYENG